MRIILVILFINAICVVYGQKSRQEILSERAQHLKELTDTAYHMLNQEEINNLGSLDYFDFDSTYQITAKFIRDKGKKFKMPTSTDRLPVYRRYGYIDFKIDTIQCRLTVYQNVRLSKTKEYKNYLFIPFKDKTTRNETYGGGRFIETEIQEGNEFFIDFNTAFNPYCAYSYRYSCPIPPEENTLNVKILAGEKTPLTH
jgi:uncharacterized protein (DUF1684 family)